MSEDENGVEIIKPPNKLKDKVGGGPNAQFNAKVLARTERAVEKFAGNYTDRAQAEIAAMREQLTVAEKSPEDCGKALREMSMIAREMKGQAKTFSYDLLTDFGDSLYNFTRDMDQAGPRQLDVIRAHIDAMSAVVKFNIKGSGDTIGQQLKKELDIAKDKFRSD